MAVGLGSAAAAMAAAEEEERRWSLGALAPARGSAMGMAVAAMGMAVAATAKGASAAEAGGGLDQAERVAHWGGGERAVRSHK
jgi:hypothetical protein